MVLEWLKKKTTVGLYLITKYFNYILKWVTPKKKDSPIRVSECSELIIGKNVNLLNSEIKLTNKSSLTIDDNVTLTNYNINIDNGTLTIGNNSMLEQGNQPMKPVITILTGKLIIGNHNKIKSNILIKFEGNCTIGDYNSINEQTEIRCDEEISIGDFNMISYDCIIYDTNTHCIYEPKKRRSITKNDFPDIGAEQEKPMTKPIRIDNDCWIGKRAIVLKGSVLESNSILGTGSILSGKLKSGTIGVGNPAKSIKNITYYESNT
jgi:acetyltransferase-like isoleucine patch superfamily enzyme